MAELQKYTIETILVDSEGNSFGHSESMEFVKLTDHNDMLAAKDAETERYKRAVEWCLENAVEECGGKFYQVFGRTERIEIPAEFVDIISPAAAVGQEGQQMLREKADWISMLRAHGVKMAHPDDGCVTRHRDPAKLDYLQPCYPQFLDGEVLVGDTIALGWPKHQFQSRQHRIVKVVQIEATMFGSKRYYFKP